MAGAPLQNLNFLGTISHAQFAHTIDNTNLHDITNGENLPALTTNTGGRYEDLTPSNEAANSRHYHIAPQRQKNGGIDLEAIATCLGEPVKFLHSMDRGFVLVINNIQFNNARYPNGSEKILKHRYGSDKDEITLGSFFKSTVNWEEFHVKRNLTAEEMKYEIKNVSGKDFRHFSAFFLFVLSHGCEDGIYGVDGQVMQIEPILRDFAADSCPSLANKPKIFVMQACRGELTDTGHRLNETDSPADLESRMVSIPMFSDFLITYPCIPGYTALRSESKGTYFVQILVDLLKRFYKDEHIVDILLRVNFAVAETMNSAFVKSMPCQDVRMRMKCYFEAYFIKITDKMKKQGLLSV